MKLSKIQLKNFRQFYGEQTIECSVDPKKNVTLIHAENGVGKTTLLNSILWAFYGETTSRFEQREQIVNFEALKESKANASVSVNFELDDTDYIVQRHFTNGGDRRGAEKFAAFKVEGGNYKALPAAETFINSVLPKEMARYFFFDGEHAEAFAAEANHKAVGKAIRSMLGCDVAETAISDLKFIANELGREMGNVPGDSAMQELEQKITSLQAEEEQDQKQIDDLETQIESLEAQKEAILNKLRETAGAKEIQQLRDTKVAQLKQVNEDIKAAEEDILKWIGQRAILVVARKLAQQTLEFVDEASLRGRIPSPYNEEFVKGLLSGEKCICERPLVPGSPEFAAVMNLIKSASNAEVMGRVVRARARVQQINENAGESPKVLELLQGKIANLVQRRIALDQEVTELGKKLEGIPVAEIQQREAARVDIEKRIRSKEQELGGTKQRIQMRKRQVEECERELEKLASRSQRGRKFMIRRDLAQRAADMLKALLASHEQESRRTIQKFINDIFKETARREYKFRFNDNFSMELLFEDGRPVPRSGGENQLMSLAFTSALVKFAALRANASGDVLTPGTIAPLVLDSPFGQLDAKYREATAKFVPQMASQVILLVSSSQGDDTVLRALEPRVGAEYLLISENRGPRGDKPEDRMILRNREYKASLFGRPRTLTRIERII